MPVVEQPRLRVQHLPGHAQRDGQRGLSCGGLVLRGGGAEGLAEPAPADVVGPVHGHARGAQVVVVQEEHVRRVRAVGGEHRQGLALHPHVLADGRAGVAVLADELALVVVDVDHRGGGAGGGELAHALPEAVVGVGVGDGAHAVGGHAALEVDGGGVAGGGGGVGGDVARGVVGEAAGGVGEAGESPPPRRAGRSATTPAATAPASRSTAPPAPTPPQRRTAGYAAEDTAACGSYRT
jgi:hypothetical protein